MKAPSENDFKELGPADKKSYVAGLRNGVQEARAEAAKPPPAPAQVQIRWGRNVLPAGLYAFEFSPIHDEDNPLRDASNRPVLLKHAGELIGLRPVVFFCGEGVEKPQPKQLPVSKLGVSRTLLKLA